MAKMKDHDKHRAGVIAAAIADGRIPGDAATRAGWASAFDGDMIAACNILGALPRGVHGRRPAPAAAPLVAAAPVVQATPTVPVTAPSGAVTQEDAEHRAFMASRFPATAAAMGYEQAKPDISVRGFGRPLGPTLGITGS